MGAQAFQVIAFELRKRTGLLKNTDKLISNWEDVRKKKTLKTSIVPVTAKSHL
jgi:hypothetical protein